jgi:hypothetical protein
LNIFLISPVADKDPKKQKQIRAYVRKKEMEGHTVHWPIRDTKQDDSTGGYDICRANFTAIIKADEVHIWYDETSGGSKFDMGGVFMRCEMMGHKMKVKLANKDKVVDLNEKSFFKVFCRVEKNTK